MKEFLNTKTINFSYLKKNNVALFLALIVLSVVFSILNPNFIKINNLTNVVRQMSVLSIASVGVTLCMLVGGIDLSVGSIMAFVSVISATYIVRIGIVPGIIIGLCVGAIFGLLQGSIIAKWSIPAFIVTLGGQTFFRGATFIYSNGLSVSGLPKSFYWIGNGNIFGIPVPGIIALFIYLFFHFILTRTKTGRYIYAVGGNEDAARLSGIRIFKYKVFVHTMCGLLSAIAGIVLTSRVFSGQPTLAESYALDSIAACVIGGTSFRGGEGSMIGTILGVLTISIIRNGLNLIRVSSFAQMMIIGAIIVIAVIIDSTGKKKTA
jgi:ribose/xylose/arabinose/galactoside ABC-type transport system permease subunit